MKNFRKSIIFDVISIIVLALDIVLTLKINDNE